MCFLNRKRKSRPAHIQASPQNDKYHGWAPYNSTAVHVGVKQGPHTLWIQQLPQPHQHVHLTPQPSPSYGSFPLHPAHPVETRQQWWPYHYQSHSGLSSHSSSRSSTPLPPYTSAYGGTYHPHQSVQPPVYVYNVPQPNEHRQRNSRHREPRHDTNYQHYHVSHRDTHRPAARRQRA